MRASELALLADVPAFPKESEAKRSFSKTHANYWKARLEHRTYNRASYRSLTGSVRITRRVERPDDFLLRKNCFPAIGASMGFDDRIAAKALRVAVDKNQVPVMIVARDKTTGIAARLA